MEFLKQRGGRAILQRRWLLLAVLALVLALPLAIVVRNSPVEISVDLDEDAGKVSAHWQGGETTLEPLDEAWAPHHYTVTITAPGDGKDRGGGYQLIAMTSIDKASYSDPSLWAHASTYFMLHGQDRPAVLQLEGWTIGPDPYLSFETDFASENVVAQSGNKPPERLTLHTEQHGNLQYPIETDARRYRYTGQVPRRFLGQLELSFSDSVQPVIQRLYINTLIPRIYYADDLPQKAPAGIRQSHWQPTWAQDRLVLPQAWWLGANVVLDLGRLWIVLFLGLTLVVVPLQFIARCFIAQWRSTPTTHADAAFPWPVFAGFWLPAFLVWCFFLLNFYPGTLNADSLTQWSEIQTFKFTPIHPPIYALAMWLGTFLWDSPATTAFFQILAASLIMASAFTLLWKAGVSRSIVLVLYILTVVSPRNNTTLISLLKDTPYSIALMGMTLCLAWYLVQPQRKVGLRWGIAGLCLGCAAVFRHNGPLLAAALLPLLLIYFPRQWRAWCLLVAGFLVVFLGVKDVIYPRISIEQGEGGFHDLTTCHLAILLDRDVPLRSEDYAFLSQVRDLQDRWGYDPRRVASTTQPLMDYYHRAWAKEHAGPYLTRYTHIMKDHLLNGANYLRERGEFLYIPWQTKIEMETYFLGISRNDLGLWSSDFLLVWPDKIRAALAWTAMPARSWIFWRPALPLYGILIACIVLCIRQRNIAWSIVYLPFVLNTGTIALAAISQACRYQFPLTFAAAFLVGLAFLPSPTHTSSSEAIPNIANQVS